MKHFKYCFSLCLLLGSVSLIRSLTSTDKAICSELILVKGDIRYDPFTTPLLEGTVATHSCPTGNGLRLSGGIERICQSNGSWSGDVITCIDVDCGVPPIPTNGQVDLVDGKTSLYGRITYSCDLCYSLNGRPFRVCDVDGMWSNAMPTCNITDCGHLPTLLNGTVEVNPDTTCNGTATYTCDQGFDLIGVVMLTCQIDGKWSGRFPYCTPVSCGPSPLVANGYFRIPTRITFGERVTYSCFPEYALIGSATITCLANRSWSLPPVCAAITCASLPTPPYSSIVYSTDTNQSFPIGTSAFYSTYCPVGMERKGGDDVRTCIDNSYGVIGVWNGTAPTCVRQAVFISISGINYFTNNSNISLTDIGSTNITSLVCHTNSTTCCRGRHNPYGVRGFGEWLFPDGTRISQDSVRGTNNFYWIREYQAIYLYRQSHNLLLVPLGSYCCRIPDSSDIFRTFCANLITITCEPLPTPPYGSIVYTTFHFIIGTNAFYSTYCPVGMERKGGDDVRTCIDNSHSVMGVWSGTAPTCVRQTVFLSMFGINHFINNSAIIVSDIGSTNITSLTCHTASTTCCRDFDNSYGYRGFGEWLFPNGTRISQNSVAGDGFYWIKDYQAIHLYRQGNIQTPLGQYCCKIPDSVGQNKTFCAYMTAIRCDPLASPSNGTIAYSNVLEFGQYLFGTFATYSCSMGFALINDNQTRTCVGSGEGTVGRFNGSQPACNPITCSQLPDHPHGSIKYSNSPDYYFGTQAMYEVTCPDGHERRGGDDVRTCTGNGHSTIGVWNGTAPICSVVDCGEPENPLNGRVDTSKGTFFTNTSVYSCNSGQHIVGCSEAECLANGTWSCDPPHCVAMIQLKFGPTSHCVDWKESRVQLMYELVRTSIVKAIQRQGYSIPKENIQQGYFSCFRSTTEVTFRTTITGTERLSAVDYTDLIQEWVESGVTTRVLWYAIKMDKTCPVAIASMNQDECAE